MWLTKISISKMNNAICLVSESKIRRTEPGLFEGYIFLDFHRYFKTIPLCQSKHVFSANENVHYKTKLFKTQISPTLLQRPHQPRIKESSYSLT